MNNFNLLEGAAQQAQWPGHHKEDVSRERAGQEELVRQELHVERDAVDPRALLQQAPDPRLCPTLDTSRSWNGELEQDVSRA